MSARFCGHCGAPAGPSMTFCPHCGTALPPVPAGAAPMTSAGAPPVVAAPVVPVAPGAGPVICPRCGAVNPPTSRFCGRCALALLPGAPGMAAAGQMYPLASPSQIASAIPHKTAKRSPWAFIGAFGVVAMVVLAIVAHALTPTPTPGCGTHCPPPPPPLQPPLPPQHQYVSTTYGYALDYDYSPTAQDGQSIGWQGTLNDGTVFLCKFQAEPANGRAPQQIVEGLQQSLYPGATPVYTIPGAEIGYTLGYGNIYDVTASPGNGQSQEQRIAIEVSVRDNLAVEEIVSTPFIPDKAEHPNPAQLHGFAEFFADSVGDTVTWKGEQPL